MTCPACTRPLQRRTAADIAVDACVGGCGGIWFDAHELQKFDEAAEHDGAALLDLPRDTSAVDRDARRACPTCDEVIMVRHFSSVRRTFEIDECGNCGGIFLDGGELAAMRDEFATQQDRDAAAQSAIGGSIDAALGTVRVENELERAKVRRMGRALRFLAPSWYIPGEQTWGAW